MDAPSRHAATTIQRAQRRHTIHAPSPRPRRTPRGHAVTGASSGLSRTPAAAPISRPDAGEHRDGLRGRRRRWQRRRGHADPIAQEQDRASAGAFSRNGGPRVADSARAADEEAGGFRDRPGVGASAAAVPMFRQVARRQLVYTPRGLDQSARRAYENAADSRGRRPVFASALSLHVLPAAAQAAPSSWTPELTLTVKRVPAVVPVARRYAGRVRRRRGRDGRRAQRVGQPDPPRRRRRLGAAVRSPAATSRPAIRAGRPTAGSIGVRLVAQRQGQHLAHQTSRAARPSRSPTRRAASPRSNGRRTARPSPSSCATPRARRRRRPTRRSATGGRSTSR